MKDYTPVHNKGKASYTDMQLIRKAKHMIIANSSFSYWGAVIGEKEDKYAFIFELNKGKVLVGYDRLPKIAEDEQTNNN